MRQRVDVSLSVTVTGAVRCYSENETTKALLQLLDVSTTAPQNDAVLSAALRHLERYSLCEGRLYYQAGHHTTPRLVLPRVPALLEHVLEEFHDRPVYGHIGVRPYLPSCGGILVLASNDKRCCEVREGL